MALQTVDDYIEADLCHSIHTSGRRSFRGCRRRWNWLFNEFYYPRETVKPLEFGVAYHKGMETLYTPALWDKPRDVVLEMSIQTFRRACDEQLKSYRELIGEPDADKLEDFRERKELGEGMLRYHVENIEPGYRLKGYRPIKVEVKFEVPIKNPDTGEQLWCRCMTCFNRWLAIAQPQGKTNARDALNWDEDIYKHWNGLPVTYGGRIDAIFEDESGMYWVVDWKSAATLAEESQRKLFLELDDQITSYVWALNQCGVRVIGFLYVEQKKAFAQPPAILTRRYKGKLFSTNKDQPTSLEIFTKTVEENDPEGFAAGAYEEYLDKLMTDPPRYYAEYTCYRSDAQLNQCGINIYKESVEMINPDLHIYPNAGRFNCQTCAFAQPCLEQNSEGDVLYTLETLFDKRKYHYWEDKKPSTESKGGE